jgi:hypothetical protein
MNDDIPKPMLNSGVEAESVGEDFEKNVIGRLDGAHDARAEFNRALAELSEQERERLERFKEQSFARFEELTGLTFDRNTGRCTTEGSICMEGQVKERWEEICTKLGAEKDPQKGEQLWREAGKVLREAATPEVKPEG